MKVAEKKYQTASSHGISSLRLLVVANIVPRSPIILTFMMEGIGPPKCGLLTRAIRCNIPEDGILHSHRRENLKSPIALTGWTL
jgi:hypothetical protein